MEANCYPFDLSSGEDFSKVVGHACPNLLFQFEKAANLASRYRFDRERKTTSREVLCVNNYHAGAQKNFVPQDSSRRFCWDITCACELGIRKYNLRAECYEGLDKTICDCDELLPKRSGGEDRKLIARSTWRGEHATVLGVKVSAIDMDECVATIEGWIRDGEAHYVCVTGVHGVIESQSDENLRVIHNAAGLVTPDGMPLVWMAHWLGHKRTRRVYGPDLMRRLSALSPSRGYRHFYYGGGEGLGERLKQALSRAFPGLNVVGTITPPFSVPTSAEDDAAVAQINAARPDIVWVGLSTPKQESWMASHIGRLDAPVLIGVGAAFDFLAGEKKQAPPWMQRNGLEWLFRLTTEPKRLWRRYFSIVPRFILLAGAQLARKAWDDARKARATLRGELPRAQTAGAGRELNDSTGGKEKING